jgi:isopentenyl-diphosphate delta-isomerase
MSIQGQSSTSALIPAWVDGRLVEADKLMVHRQGIKHKAVSVFLNANGRTLIQQRAAGKYHSPLLWANACCTHPMMAESAVDCAIRRLEQELGIKEVSPTPMAEIEYRAEVGNGMVEHEVVEVLMAEVTTDLPITLNRDEVADVKWVKIDDLRNDSVAYPNKYTEWLKIYLREFADQLG